MYCASSYEVVLCVGLGVCDLVFWGGGELVWIGGGVMLDCLGFVFAVDYTYSRMFKWGFCDLVVVDLGLFFGVFGIFFNYWDLVKSGKCVSDV